MSALQLLGHIFTTAKDFIGEVRELTADTSNWDLILHDGSTPGGHRFLNRDNSDARYQARSTELDGLLDFEPQNRGYLIRLGPSNYVVRSLTVNIDNLYVENADGYDGPTLLGLAPEITSAHSWTETQTFDSPIQADGGVIGNITGDITGNVVGNVTGNVTGNLTGNASGNHTGSFTGNLNTVGHTVTMDDGQIHLSYLNDDVLDFIALRGLPPGCIVAWAGAVSEIDPAWTLCDGSNGSPDLRGLFIQGADADSGGDYNVGDTAGALTHSHVITLADGGAHAHTGDVGDTALSVDQLPVHKHGNGIPDNLASHYNHGTLVASPTGSRLMSGSSGSASVEGYTTEVGAGETHTHALTTDEGGEHTHAGSSAVSSSLPPTYVLAYIMKMVY